MSSSRQTGPPGVAHDRAEWTQTRLLTACDLRDEDLEGAGVPWQELATIYDDHRQREQELRATGTFIATLLQSMRGVHSVRMRVKSPARLVRKVVRKRREKSVDINAGTYRELIHDRVGLRALHLFKDDWVAVHKQIAEQFEFALVDEANPIAYYREGDRQEWVDEFRRHRCEPQVHPKTYRSVHYLVTADVGKMRQAVEIQVRTIIEEAWSEIDHRINYPEASDHELVRLFLRTFNRLTGNADELGTFVHELDQRLTAAAREMDGLREEREAARAALTRLVEEGIRTEAEREAGLTELERLREADAAVLERGEQGDESRAARILEGLLLPPEGKIGMLLTDALRTIGGE